MGRALRLARTNPFHRLESVMLAVLEQENTRRTMLGDFARPLPDTEVGYIAKSNAKFAEAHYSPERGWKNDDLILSDWEWWCHGCGVLNERDLNAARNLSKWPGLRFPVSGRGDCVRPAVPAVVSEASMGSALHLPGAVRHAG